MTAAAAIPQGMSALLHDFAADVDHLKRHIAAFFKCQFAMFLGARARVHLHGRQGGEVHVEWYSFVVVQHQSVLRMQMIRVMRCSAESLQTQCMRLLSKV